MESETLAPTYWVNGRCWSCGAGSTRVRRRLAYCSGCGREVGTFLSVSDASPGAERARQLGADYDAALAATDPERRPAVEYRNA